MGVPVQMVFVGTCAGGRASDFREVLRVIEAGGGRIADGVSLVLTPASGDVEARLRADGTYDRLRTAGGQWTTAGCGACCGTSGVIPAPGTTVLSTANRNFKARMGNATARIYLASPAACGAAAVTGVIADPSLVGV
jgi:3-isopropylmalate/(R)-2-methylmalate dehydratase large subunit